MDQIVIYIVYNLNTPTFYKNGMMYVRVGNTNSVRVFKNLSQPIQSRPITFYERLKYKSLIKNINNV